MEPHPGCRRVVLGSEDDRTEELVLLTPFDRLRPVSPVRGWRKVPTVHVVAAAAEAIADGLGWRRLGWVVARAPALRLLAWQMEPARAIREGEATRVLVADAVGLGKTIQAAVVHVSLSPGPDFDRTLIVVPAGLRDQWAAELRRLFGLDPVVVDGSRLRELRSTLTARVNPWGVPGVFIAAIDFIKQPEILASLLDVRWTLVVLDEAHTLAGPSDRHRAVHLIARTAQHVVMLTATPHSGDPDAFDRLCRIGETPDDPPLILRRTRVDVGLSTSRRVRTWTVTPASQERRLHAALHAYIARLHRDGVMAPEGARLAAWVLVKRAASSVHALRLTLIRRQAALAGEPAGPAQQGLPFLDPAGETQEEDDDWLPRVLEAPGMRDRSAEVDAIGHLIACAEEAEPCDRKILLAVRLIRRLREPAIVFTEYRDTLRGLLSALPGVPTAVLHGAMLRQERLESERAFSRGGARVLVATDTASEGLNLQHHCRLVINLDVPWNPTRLEQRIGRVDRIGQRRAVRVITLTSRTAGATIMRRINAKVRRIDGDLARMGASVPRHDDGTAAEVVALLKHAVAVLSTQRRREWAGHDRSPRGAARFARRVPWAKVEPRARRRLRLPSGVLLLFQAKASRDAMSGAACAAVIVELDACVLRRCRPRVLIEACARAAAPAVAHHTGPALGRDLEASARRAAATRRRLCATLDAERPLAPFQPGLFDRRAMAAALEQRRAAGVRRAAIHQAIARAANCDVDFGGSARPVAALILR